MMLSADRKKIVRQVAETERFFAGDFTVAGKAKDTAPAGSSTPATGAAAGLDELAEQVRQCRRCGLGSMRKNAVPGEGNPGACLVFVGEAPGADEDEQGRPFVGRAGQLLDRIISAMGLNRDEVFICNILKCRPPDNRDPRPEEIISCLPYLGQQLELIRPQIIVALGAHAARTLLDTNKPIGQLRGQFCEYYPSPMAAPVKLMPTFHPAYLLRNYSYENRQRVWEDMKKVVAELGRKVPGSGLG